MYLLDDDWDNDPRVIKAGTAAFGLYSRCGLWVARHLTDGFVPEEIATAYGSREWVKKLLDAGLWLTVEGGYTMPDYLVRNPTSEKVEKRREGYRIRQEKWRERTRNTSSKVQTRDKRVSSPSDNAVINASPSPLSKERRGARPPASLGGASVPEDPPVADLDDPKFLRDLQRRTAELQAADKREAEARAQRAQQRRAELDAVLKQKRDVA